MKNHVTFTTKFGKEVSLSLTSILEQSATLPCACPGEFVELLNCVRNIVNQQRKCIEENPKSGVVHTWLTSEVLKLEQSVIRILGELLQQENVINSDFEFIEKVSIPKT